MSLETLRSVVSSTTYSIILASIAVSSICYIFFEWTCRFFLLMATPENNYGYMMIGLSLYVLWRRLSKLREHRSEPSWLGVAMIVFGLGLAVVSEIGFYRRFTYVALVIVFGGFLVAHFGRHALPFLVAPMVALMLAVPVPDYVTVQLSTSLQRVSSTLGSQMLTVLGIPVFQYGNIIDLGVYKLQVAEACSGLRYLIPLLLTSLCLVWLARAPWWSKVITVAFVVPLTIGLNSFRIAMTGVLVEFHGISAAEDFMHLFEGWLIFLIAIALLTALLISTTWAVKGVGKSADLLDFNRIEARHVSPAASRRAPGGSGRLSPPLVGGVLVMGAVAASMPLLEAEDLDAPERSRFATFPLVIDEYVGRPGVVEDEVQRVLDASDHLLVDYAPPAGSNDVNLWIAYYERQQPGSTLHSPKDCLPAGGWEYERLSIREINVVGSRADMPFRVNDAVVVNGVARIAMVYWIEARGRQIASEFLNKFYNLYDTVVHRRTDGALVRVLTPVAAGESDEVAMRRVYDFIDAAYGDMRRYVGPAPVGPRGHAGGSPARAVAVPVTAR